MIFILLASLISCQEKLNPIDEIGSNKDVSVINDILVFKSIESFRSTLSSISQMTDEEISTWEEQIGFRSIKTICNEAYDQLLSNAFTSQEELVASAANYSDYLTIEENEEGDLTLETLDIDLPYNSFISENMMFQIKNIVYKITAREIFYASIENIEILKLINETNRNEIIHYKEISSFSVFHNLSAKKGSTCYTCDIDGTHENVSAKRKVYLRIYFTGFEYIVAGPDTYDIQFHSKSIAYKKIFGIWIKYKTTHTHDLEYSIWWQRYTYYDPDPGVEHLEGSYYGSSTSTTKEWNYYNTTNVYYGDDYNEDFDCGWSLRDCKAKTTGTNPEWVVLQCGLPIMIGDCNGYGY